MSPIPELRPVSKLTLEVASKDALDVREFSVREGLSALFSIEVIAASSDPAVDFSGIVGQPAKLVVESARAAGTQGRRRWTGLCSHIEQVGVEEAGVSTYALTLVPELWLLTQRRNYRMFQQVSEPQIVLALLKEWSIVPEVRLRLGDYKERKTRVQYAETDYAFLSRMLEDAGLTFSFEDGEGDAGTKLVLSKVLRFMNVRDLVEQILGALGPSGIIVELIIDDHGAPDMHLLGDDWIFGSASGQKAGGGYGRRYTDSRGLDSNMTKHPDLYRLNRRFHPRGVVTLQGCEVTAHRRTRLLELLSAWFGGVEVRAGDKVSKPGLLGIEEGNHFTGCRLADRSFASPSCRPSSTARCHDR